MQPESNRGALQEVVPEAPSITPVRYVSQGRVLALVGLASGSFLGGLVEAAFLLTIGRMAFLLVEGDDQLELVGGVVLDVEIVLGISALLILLRVVLAALTSWHAAAISSEVLGDVRRELNEAYLEASWEIQHDESAGGFQELSINYGGQASTLISNITQVITTGVQLVAMLGIAIFVDPIGAALLAVMLAALAMVLRPLRGAMRRRARKKAATGMEFAKSLNEVSQLGLELHIFHVQDAAKTRLEALNAEVKAKERALVFLDGMVSPLYSAIAYVALLSVLALVVIFDISDVAALGAVVLVMLRSLSYGQTFQSSYTRIGRLSPAVETLLVRLEHYRRNRRHDGGDSVGIVGTLVFDDVSFAYPGTDDVLKALSFEIMPREIVGIVGPSGGGKTTLVQLVLGLRDPRSGAIFANGRDIRELSKAEWARHVTLVPQSAHLIKGSVADNIRFLREGVDQAEIERAARLANLHDDVDAFPDGYDHSVGEKGGNLSGGQQQRLCIARALVEAPDVMVLDEPTSSLDVRSEHLIRETLLGLKERMTVIVVAHRLSTLEICDRIMVIQAGELKGFDSPSRLERTSDFYREALALSGLR